MRLIMTSEMRDEYAKKLSEIFNDYSYTGSKTGINEQLLNSTDYRKILKEFLRDLISNNINAQPKGDITEIFTTNPDEGERDFDELASLAMDYLIGIDVKRSTKNRLYQNVTQIPTDDFSDYLNDLKRVMISGEMIKPKMTDKKWIAKWASLLKKYDHKGINDFAKASTQKSGLAGAFEKMKNKKAVKKQNPSPINNRGLNDVLNSLTEGKNLVELTPQVYKALGAGKVNTAPKINQAEKAAVEQPAINTEETK